MDRYWTSKVSPLIYSYVNFDDHYGLYALILCYHPSGSEDILFFPVHLSVYPSALVTRKTRDISMKLHTFEITMVRCTCHALEP